MKKFIYSILLACSIVVLGSSFTEPEVTKDVAKCKSETIETIELEVQPLSAVFSIADPEIRNQIVKAQISGPTSQCFDCTKSIWGGCSKWCIDAYGHTWIESCTCPPSPPV